MGRKGKKLRNAAVSSKKAWGKLESKHNNGLLVWYINRMDAFQLCGRKRNSISYRIKWESMKVMAWLDLEKGIFSI